MENKIKWINETTERYKILVDSMLDFIETLAYIKRHKENKYK